MNIVLDTNCLLMSLSRRSAYYPVWRDFVDGKYTLGTIPIKKNTKVTKKHPPSVTFNAQMPRFSQTFCTFAAEKAAKLLPLGRSCGIRYNIKYVFIMARPIKETPILYGEDARRFEARMQERRRISPEERAEMKATYEALKSVCDFM